MHEAELRLPREGRITWQAVSDPIQDVRAGRGGAGRTVKSLCTVLAVALMLHPAAEAKTARDHSARA